ncbi:MAG: hypothetical protein HZA52_12320 [Planctomycetes bacterium]|nr:hypothetical protein [Planctomycetota bacterium]
MPRASTSNPPRHPREGDPAFRRLPDEVKREVRAGWAADAAQELGIAELEKLRRRRAWLEGALLIAGTELLLKAFAPLHLGVALGVGLGVGEAWWRTGAGQMLTPLIATVPYLALQLAWLALGIGQPSALLFGAAFIAFTSSYLGVRREQRIGE